MYPSQEYTRWARLPHYLPVKLSLTNLAPTGQNNAPFRSALQQRLWKLHSALHSLNNMVRGVSCQSMTGHGCPNSCEVALVIMYSSSPFPFHCSRLMNKSWGDTVWNSRNTSRKKTCTKHCFCPVRKSVWVGAVIICQTAGLACTCVGHQIKVINCNCLGNLHRQQYTKTPHIKLLVHFHKARICTLFYAALLCLCSWRPRLQRVWEQYGICAICGPVKGVGSWRRLCGWRLPLFPGETHLSAHTSILVY